MSDLSLAEAFAEAFRRRRVFEVFVRALGPGEPVHIAATSFTADGRMRRTVGRARTLERAVLELLAELDADDLRPPQLRPAAARPARSRSQATVPEPREVDAPRRPRLQRIALERVARLGSVTARGLAEVSGVLKGGKAASQAALDEARHVLATLASAGELVSTRTGDYVAASSPATTNEPITEPENP